MGGIRQLHRPGDDPLCERGDAEVEEPSRRIRRLHLRPVFVDGAESPHRWSEYVGLMRNGRSRWPPARSSARGWRARAEGAARVATFALRHLSNRLATAHT